MMITWYRNCTSKIQIVLIISYPNRDHNASLFCEKKQFNPQEKANQTHQPTTHPHTFNILILSYRNRTDDIMSKFPLNQVNLNCTRTALG